MYMVFVIFNIDFNIVLISEYTTGLKCLELEDLRCSSAVAVEPLQAKTGQLPLLEGDPHAYRTYSLSSIPLLQICNASIYNLNPTGPSIESTALYK
ncbi:unnamed protein product [Xylocopa violacea]|uniref:Uncharacterized protein n=1 Tax=Xylocopa violacea TaxID=135666 RepID=A0ABP1NYC0_XYLVO